MDRSVFTSITFIDEALKDNEAMVVTGGLITHLGTEDECRDQAGENARIFDLEGSLVSAGFIDTHTHFLHTGLHLNMIPLFDCLEMESLLERLREESRGQTGWIKGYGFDESLFKERRRPGRSDLDRLETSRPVVIFRRDYHSCVVNSALLKSLEIPAGIASEETEKGYFRGRANDWIRQFISTRIGDEERLEAMKRATERAFSRGITTLCALEGGTLFGMEDLDFMVSALPSWPLRIVLYPQITDLGWVKSHGLPRVGGCLLVDGSFGSSTAALTGPYEGDPCNRGVLYFEDQALEAFVDSAHREGLQLSFHAIGDRAIAQLVRAYEKALTRNPRHAHRHRIEHCELPAPEDIERIERLGLTLAVQPAFEYLWGGEGKMYHQRLGSERIWQTNPLREFTSRNILVAGGSDSDVTPLDPLLGVEAAVTHPNSTQRLSREKALALFTEDAARICFLEQDVGSLSPGKAADFVILSGDPHRVHENSIKDIEVYATFAGGEPVYLSKEERICRKSWKSGLKPLGR
jgi:predicted amidohydrolase YtcJ